MSCRLRHSRDPGTTADCAPAADEPRMGQSERKAVALARVDHRWRARVPARVMRAALVHCAVRPISEGVSHAAVAYDSSNARHMSLIFVRRLRASAPMSVTHAAHALHASTQFMLESEKSCKRQLVHNGRNGRETNATAPRTARSRRRRLEAISLN